MYIVHATYNVDGYIFLTRTSLKTWTIKGNWQHRAHEKKPYHSMCWTQPCANNPNKACTLLHTIAGKYESNIGKKVQMAIVVRAENTAT